LPDIWVGADDGGVYASMDVGFLLGGIVVEISFSFDEYG
jgi:hypothetical protein